MSTLIIIISSVVLVGFVYLRWLRPWQLRWGASDQEVERLMLGDEIVEKPTFNATRGVTIHSNPENIWPWLVQIGINRAGWYSYDCLDNLCRPSAEQILPEFQNLNVGDLVPLSPDGTQGFWVKELHPNRQMLWWDQKGKASWLWHLEAIDKTHTRLITRVRVRYTWFSPDIIFNLLIEFADIIMMRKCMLGIQRRAERMAKKQWQNQSESYPPNTKTEKINVNPYLGL